MKEVSGYNISEQDFKKVSKWAEDVYNIAVIVDYFVGNQPEIEECYNLPSLLITLLVISRRLKSAITLLRLLKI